MALAHHSTRGPFGTSRPAGTLPLAGVSGALAAVETTFRLLTTGPDPVAVDGRDLGLGLPRRVIPLGELASMLMHPSSSQALSDEVWRLLVTRTRSGDPKWVVASAGVALPGLWRAASRAARATGAEDAQSHVLEGFLNALWRVDLSQPGVCAFLCRHAFKHARAVGLAEEQPAASGLPCFAPRSALPPPLWGHPDLLLAKAVRLGVITDGEAQLIGDTRLESTNIAEHAARTGESKWALYKRRERAEQRLITALRAGDLSDPDTDAIAEATMTVVPDPADHQ